MSAASNNTRTAIERLLAQGDRTYCPALLDCIADNLDVLGAVRDAAKFRIKADAIRASKALQEVEA